MPITYDVQGMLYPIRDFLSKIMMSSICIGGGGGGGGEQDKARFY